MNRNEQGTKDTKVSVSKLAQRAARESMPYERVRIAEALGASGDPEAVPVLCTMLDTVHPDEGTASIEALVRHGERARVALSPLLEADEEHVVRNAAKALARLGDAAAHELLATRFLDHRGTRAFLEGCGRPGLLALCSFGAYYASSIDDFERESTVRALVANAALVEDDLHAILEQSSPDSEATAELFAADVLTRLGTPRALASVLAVLENCSARVELRAVIVYALGETRGLAIEDVLARLHADTTEEEEVRSACALVLGKDAPSGEAA